MARHFQASSSTYISIASAVATATPLSIACWFYNYDTVYTDALLMDLHNNASASGLNCFQLMCQGFGSGGGVQAVTGDGATNEGVSSRTPNNRDWKPFNWTHAAGVFASAASRAVYMNAGDKATGTASITPSGINRTTIGRESQVTPGNYFYGRIMDVAIWNVALEDAEIAKLAGGVARPDSIRPESLQLYVPLPPYGAPVDLQSNFNLTDNGTWVAADPPQLQGRAYARTANPRMTLPTYPVKRAGNW